MRRLLYFMVLLFMAIPAFAQRSPNDAEAQDSIIINNARIISHDTLVIDVSVTSHDSIVSFDIPLTFMAAGLSMHDREILPSESTERWEILDTVNYVENILSIRGTGTNAAAFSGANRIVLFSIKLQKYSRANSEQWILFGHDKSGANRTKRPIIGHSDGSMNYAKEIQAFLILIPPDSVRIAEVPSILVPPLYVSPFGPVSNSRFYLTRPQFIRLELRNVLGTLVSAVEKDYPPGFNEHRWDYKDLDGNPLPSGIYYTHIIGEDTTIVQKITMLK